MFCTESRKKTETPRAEPMPLGRRVLLVLALVVSSTSVQAEQPPVNLGRAADFGALAGSGVINLAPVGTLVAGNLGVSPHDIIRGFPPGMVFGVSHLNDHVAQTAQQDLALAYEDAAGRTVPLHLGGETLGGECLFPGLYRARGSIEITADNLTLDGEGDRDAVWIFQIASSLATGTGSQVILINEAQPSNVFWQVGGSVAIGNGSTLQGNVLALESIALSPGATLVGRALTSGGEIRLDGASVIMPSTSDKVLMSALPKETPCIRMRLILLGRTPMAPGNSIITDDFTMDNVISGILPR
jgi:hypothetical protein